MSKEINLCEKCGNFTLKDECKCGGKTYSAKPAKWSPEDKWGEYRRAYKQRISTQGN